MTVRHHLSDEMLLDYAAGSLDEGFSLAVASHLALCPACRQRLAVFEQAGGALLSDIVCEDAASDHSWDKLRARIASQPQAEAKPKRVSARSTAEPPVLPQPLRSYLGSDVSALKWRSLGRGAYHIPIAMADGKSSVRLLRIPAGKPVPEHGHGGRELTLVLSGSFRDGDDRFGRGDIEEADEQMQHQPVAGDECDCICLAVTDAPLKFRSWLLKAVQPMLGI